MEKALGGRAGTVEAYRGAWTELDAALAAAPERFIGFLPVPEIPGRTLFGSDAPYGDPVLAPALVERVTSPGEVRDRVLGGTIAELVGLG
ncbi:hypothetical protein [Streptomyces sp. NPDC014006]|uniref:hypothetical protein n=1 Tax=Streptomyces sp. NPDC014006 TaxID=3364870 RepID=UPI0036FDEA96